MRPGHVALLLVGIAILVLAPFGPWLVLALWVGGFARRPHAAIARVLGGRPRVAAGVTIAMLVAVLVPIVLLAVSMVLDAIALVQRLGESERARDLVQQLADSSGRHERAGFVDLVVAQGDRAWAIASQVAGAAAHVALGLVVFVAAVWSVLVDGDRWYAWAEANTPIPSFRRFAAAFVETGRGLFVGIAGAGAAQALVATIAYIAIGVPQPLALGVLTLACSLIPAIGTSLVWVPVSIGLALDGRPGSAIVLAALGLGVISTIDNIIRPFLVRRGHLQLPTVVVLASMFGGIELVGAWGLLLGPLAVRLAKEALAVLRET